MAIELPPLPFAKEALAPHMSAETLDYHHGKHHKAYVDKTNGLIAGSALEDADLETIVRRAHVDQNQQLFNQAAQAWNHGFFWQSLRPAKGAAPSGALAEAIEEAFDGDDGFAAAFKKEAGEHFASGWAWLIAENGALKVISTHDADTALVRDGVTPLIVLDVWEHAYYIDYRNERPEFIEAFLGELINWDFAAANFDAATKIAQSHAA